MRVLDVQLPPPSCRPTQLGIWANNYSIGVNGAHETMAQSMG